MTDPQFRPGCFGSPLAHVNTAPCTACPFQQPCWPAAEARSKTLKARFGIDAVLRRRPASARAVTPQAGMRPVEALPKKGLELLERWRARGIDLKQAVADGSNPFDTGAAFMRIAIRNLLAGGFTRPALRQAFVAELGWSEASASSHAGFAVPVLLTTGAAIERAGRIVPFNQEMTP